MAQGPEKQPQAKNGNAWLIGVGALFAGYVLGQNSTPAARQSAYSESSPPAVLAAAPETSADDDSTLIDMNASVDEPAAAGSPDVAAEEDESSSDETALAYVPITTIAEEAGHDPYEAIAVPVASASEEPRDSSIETSATAAAAAASTIESNGPWTRYQPANSVPSYQPRNSFTPSVGYSGSSAKCEGLGCYGEISMVTGRPRTTYVRGYTRRDGTYVQPHYRSRRR